MSAKKAPKTTPDNAAHGGRLRRPSPSPVLDACCGSRMFWFDKADERAAFMDRRRESHTLPDISSKGGSRELVVDPDYLADFTAMPFPDESFALVVFDPPHFERNGSSGWVGLKYGTLKGDWREMLRAGFAECFRVLKADGTLIFKWCADEIPVSQILALTPERPLFGHKSGKQQKTHWVTFLKSQREAAESADEKPDGQAEND
jgi:SAM-dependent methyltransferase